MNKYVIIHEHREGVVPYFFQSESDFETVSTKENLNFIIENLHIPYDDDEDDGLTVEPIVEPLILVIL